MPTVPQLSKLDRDPLHERVYRQLHDAIVSAEFEPGQRLTVRMIASAFGTSTMPVRAAFARLVAEKAIVAFANGTVAIPDLTRDGFLELVDLRLMLEGAAARKAAARITKSEIRTLRKLATQLTDAAENNEAKAYIEANRAFKFAVFDIAASPALRDLIERVWLQIGPFMSYYSQDVRVQIETDEHDAIVDALAKADGEAARRAIELDIRGGADFILNVVPTF